MRQYSKIINQSDRSFKRQVGLSKNQFHTVLHRLRQYLCQLRKNNPLKNRGKKSSIKLENKLLLTLYYMRHYPIFILLANIFNISESYANKIFHKTINIIATLFHVKGNKSLEDINIKDIVIDVSEQPIERPMKGQKKYYSGKKKQHTIKAQLVANTDSLEILSVIADKGSKHDFTIFKESKIVIPETTTIRVDLGYKGIEKLHKNALIPHKKTKGQSLSKEQKEHNHKLSKMRIVIEHLNRECKIFRIVKDVFRGKHKNYEKNWNCIAGLVNLKNFVK